MEMDYPSIKYKPNLGQILGLLPKLSFGQAPLAELIMAYNLRLTLFLTFGNNLPDLGVYSGNKLTHCLEVWKRRS